MIHLHHGDRILFNKRCWTIITGDALFPEDTLRLLRDNPFPDAIGTLTNAQPIPMGPENERLFAEISDAIPVGLHERVQIDDVTYFIFESDNRLSFNNVLLSE